MCDPQFLRFILFTEKFRIGSLIRLETWAECYLIIDDIGIENIYGRIINGKTGAYIQRGIYPHGMRWVRYQENSECEKVINSLKVKERKWSQTMKTQSRTQIPMEEQQDPPEKLERLCRLRLCRPEGNTCPYCGRFVPKMQPREIFVPVDGIWA